MAFHYRTDSFKHPKSLVSLYISSASRGFQQHTGQSISQVHHWNVSYRHLWPINQNHQQAALVGRHLHFSAVQASARLKASDWAWQSAGLLLSLLKCQRLMALWSIKLLSALWFLPLLLSYCMLRFSFQMGHSDSDFHSELFIVRVTFEKKPLDWIGILDFFYSLLWQNIK